MEYNDQTEKKKLVLLVFTTFGDRGEVSDATKILLFPDIKTLSTFHSFRRKRKLVEYIIVHMIQL